MNYIKPYLSLGYIIFDLDGTLIDSMKQHREIFGRILDENFGIQRNISQEIYVKTAGKPLDEQFEIVLHQFGIQSTDVISLVGEFWTSVEKFRFLPFKDVPPSIRILHNANYAMFITSGSTNAVVKSKLEHSGIQDCFQLTLGSDYSTSTNKKGVDHFRLIKSHLGLETGVFRQNTILVGDGKHDMQLAKEENFFSILRIADESPRDIVSDMQIRDLTQLVNFLKSENSDSGKFMKVSNARRNWVKKRVSYGQKN